MITMAKAMDLMSVMFRTDIRNLNVVKPRPKLKKQAKRKAILTDEEQRIINIEVNHRENYGNGPVKVLSPEEIKALQPQITPINLISRQK